MVERQVPNVVHWSRDKDYARRALALPNLWETRGNVSEIAQRLRAARSSVQRWRWRYERYDDDGLRSRARGRKDGKATEEVLSVLETMVNQNPRELGYLRFRWSSQLLAIELAKRSGVQVHATTLRRDPRKAECLAAIEHWCSV